MNRHHSTISRELERNGSSVSYSSEKADESYHIRRENSKPKGKRTSSLIEIIEEKLALSWSPEQIEGRILKGKLCFKTIY
jgi:transposase, IS30 family